MIKLWFKNKQHHITMKAINNFFLFFHFLVLVDYNYNKL